MDRTAKIGKYVLNYRKTQGYTIKNFSQITGLSTALLSELERGVGNPTLYVLETLSNTMGISLSTLLEQEIQNLSLVQRKADRLQTLFPDAQHLYNILAVSPVRSNLELLLLELEPGEQSNQTWSVHPYWEEIAYVVSGSVYILFEDEKIPLYEGDTIRILPDRRHNFMNESSLPASVLFASSRS